MDVSKDKNTVAVTGISFDREVLAKLDDLAESHRLSRSRMAMEMLRSAMGMPSLFGLPADKD